MRHGTRTLLGVLLCLAVTIAVVMSAVAAQASANTGWLGDTAPAVSKVVSLLEGVSPPGANNDCYKFWFTPPFPDQQSQECVFDTPLGKVGGGMLYVSESARAPLKGPLYSDAVVPTPSSSLMLLYRSGGHALGSDLGFYSSLTKGSVARYDDILSPYYGVTAEPNNWLVNPVNGEKIPVNGNALAFSANMQWMVVDTPGFGLLRVNMSDLSAVPFAKSLESYDFYGLSDGRITISNDGRFAAVSLVTGNGGGQEPSIKVYDLATCTGSFSERASVGADCQYKDAWTGLFPDGHETDRGIRSQLPPAGSPVHLRFVDDNNISFNTTYNRESSSRFDAATFVATVNNAPIHKLGLLGMGDSYISGQGTFAYRPGTDTSNNGCHLSELSYPYLLGSAVGTHNSVACSGAEADDITRSEGSYNGQTKDGTKQKDRQDKDQILSEFLPGYLNQNQFASTYTPQVVLLSVGGNNIGFSDILASCVKNAGGNTCYDNYEDRLELLNLINRSYDTLRKTYASIKGQSPGVRLYVVGYPHIAKANGSCGLNVHLDAREITFSEQLIDYLDGVISQAARAEGVQYVDVRNAFDGHRLCEASGGQSAMNGLTAGNDAGVTIAGKTINILGAESYHPTQLGHQLLARSIAAQTHSLTDEMPLPDAAALPPLPSNALEMLQSVPHTNRPLNRTFYDATIASDVMTVGGSGHINVNGTEAQLKPGATYQAVLHTTPISLATVTANQDGDVLADFTIPGTAEPGMHTIHIYGNNIAGEAIDIQKIVYVAPVNTELNGNCALVSDSGSDLDSDGLDDACDPIIANMHVATTDSNTINVPAPIASTAMLQTKVVVQPVQPLTAHSVQAMGAISPPAVLGTTHAAQTPVVAAIPPTPNPITHSVRGVQYGLAFAGSMVGVAIVSYAYRKFLSYI